MPPPLTRWKATPPEAGDPQARAAELVRAIRPAGVAAEREVDAGLRRLQREVLDPVAPRRGLGRWPAWAVGLSMLVGLNAAFGAVVLYGRWRADKAPPGSGEPPAIRRVVPSPQPSPLEGERVRVPPSLQPATRGVVPSPQPSPLEGERARVPPSLPTATRPENPLPRPERRDATENPLPQRGRGQGEGVVAPAPAPADADSLAQESALVGRALTALSAGEAASALASANDYLGRYPAGSLRGEAETVRLDALVALGRRGEALALLDALAAKGFAGLPRPDELRVLRGDLLLEQGRFTEALASFGAPGPDAAPTLRERALYGEAVARARLGDAQGSRRDFARYLQAFPEGRHAKEAREALAPAGAKQPL